MRKQVFEVLKKTGIPVAHMAFEKGKAPALPFMVYIQGETYGFYADDSNYHNYAEFTVELYQQPTSRQTEEKLEAALSELGAWSRDEEIWIESEGCIETIYHFTVFDRSNNG